MKKLAALALAACAVLALAAPAAQASPCAPRPLTAVFAPWNDRALYTLAPDGDFEGGAAGWTLAGPVRLATDSSPFRLGGAVGAQSLELARGSSAVSPPICVQHGFPVFRFVTRSAAGALSMEVRYADGTRKSAGQIRPGAVWAPTHRIALAQGRFGGPTLVRLRFAATAGTVRVDDVYVDPRYRR